MLKSTQKNAKNVKIYILAQIVIMALALIGFLICQFAVTKEKLGFVPILMLFIIYFAGAGLFYLTAGIMQKRPLSIIFGGVSLVVGLEIVFFAAADIRYWYIWIVIGLVLIIIACLAVFLSLKPTQITTEFDNQEDSQRKTYQERREELKKQAEEKEEPELPEIKSFKD